MIIYPKRIDITSQTKKEGNTLKFGEQFHSEANYDQNKIQIKPFKDSPKKKARCLSYADEELECCAERNNEIMNILGNSDDDSGAITKPSTTEGKSSVACRNYSIFPKSSFTPYIKQLEMTSSKSREDSKDHSAFAEVASSSNNDDDDDVKHLDEIQYLV